MTEPPLVARLPAPGPGDRLLVVAPHPDDEVLGAGGLLWEARRRGAAAEALYLTDGDGYPLAAAVQHRRPPTRAAMRRLAEHRRGEARSALERLGVAPERAVFLGYPDRGLRPLLLSHWERPFRSLYTGRTAPPEAPGEPYTGRRLLAALERRLRELRPTHLLFPDPADDHPDHWAGAAFCLWAWERCRADLPPEARARTYLIHRGPWPVPMRYRPEDPLEPPAELAALDPAWEAAPLAPEQWEAKTAALEAYGSQLAVMGSYLRAFLRRNELFTRWPGVEAGEPAWRFPEAVRDRWTRARWGSADLRELRVEPEAAGVRLTVLLRGRPAARIDYRLYWIPLSGEEPPRTTRFRGGRSDGEGGKCRGEELSWRVPGPAPGLAAAEAWLGPLLLDRTAWRLARPG